jgi:hypothetical protein
MKSLLALLAIALLSVGTSACSSASRGMSSASQASSSRRGSAPVTTAATPTGAYLRGDDDVDADNYSNSDDYRMRDYGHAANAVDRRAITALVERYYSKAVAEDGAAACSLIYSSLAKDPSLTKTVPEDYSSREPHPHGLPGQSCVRATSLLFSQHHEALTADFATLQVTGVRVNRVHGLALLGFRTTSERWIPVERDGGAWKIDSLLDRELP